MRSCWVDAPDPGIVVGAAGGEMSHIGRKKDPCDVSIMGCERRYRLNRSNVTGLDHAPDIDIALQRVRSISTEKVLIDKDVALIVQNCFRRKVSYHHSRL